ncbi:hypothetical protein [Microvirga massiliensis]|uniref:hypothetical protein n=1 Tax=Microvirga massiliensis TaxID=1033741 RepID=UPI000ACB6460|nr:hypothetical protein [Microvirga massiliensis]
MTRVATGSLVVAIAACFGLAIGVILNARAVAQGWLIAFVFWSGIPIGSLVLLLIHRIVGGRWGEALAPALIPAAALVPLAAIAILPLVLDLSATYPWAADPATTPSDVARLYLNWPAFIARSIVALGGWSLLVLLVVTERCSKLAAGIGLAFHGIVISLVAVDWVLSVDPGYTSSSFAAGIAIQQILSALSVAAIVGPSDLDERLLRDLSGLLLAGLLGVVYLDLMAYVVAWYGNLPEKAAWYIPRNHGAWGSVILAAIVVGAFIPFVLLLSTRARASRNVLRVAGTLILLGVALHTVWILAPAFEPSALITACIAVVALAGLSPAMSGLIRRPLLWRAAHGR